MLPSKAKDITSGRMGGQVLGKCHCLQMILSAVQLGNNADNKTHGSKCSEIVSRATLGSFSSMASHLTLYTAN